MKKDVLKNVIVNHVNANATVTLNFLSKFSNLSGDYTVLSKKRGRGKNGSMIMELQSVANGNTVTIGTKENDQLVNVVVDGETFGHADESEILPSYEPDVANAVNLKRTFKKIVDFPTSIRVESSISELSGIHTIVSSRQMKGRSGQVSVLADSGIELFSYRHSGVISNVEVLPTQEV